MQTSKFAVFRTVCEIYLTNSSEPYIKLKPLAVIRFVKCFKLYWFLLNPKSHRRTARRCLYGGAAAVESRINVEGHLPWSNQY